MSLSQLNTIIAVPPVTHCTGRPQWWDKIESCIGITLPGDYKAVINSYGYGRFGKFITPYNPFVAAPMQHNLMLGIDFNLKLYREVQAKYPDFHPKFPAFPEKGGLLPWGVDEAAGTFYWLTEGEPDEWSIVVLDDHYSDEFSQFDLSMSEFLTQWMLEGISFSIHSDEDKPTPLFEPYAPDAAVC
jgi:hypothetical protein